tara:strand:+ start:874 stop:1800 length:927 start_codon:yes stop_codon:yes gene_type:complete
MIGKKILIIIFGLFILNKNLLADIQIHIKIDDKIITNYDIEKESNYLEILNPQLSQLNLDQKLKLAKSTLINQIIKEKEIEKFLNIDNENILLTPHLKNLYLKLGLSDEQEFKKILKEKNNYSLHEIKEKIKIELLWNDLIYLKYKNQVKIDEKKILEQIDSSQSATNKEFFLSEIVFKKKIDVKLEDLYKEIKQSINEIGFNNAANIYSNSDSAKFGGKIGWINEISLSNEMREKLNSLDKGNFTELIKIGNNFLILKIEDIRIKKIEINKDEEFKKLIDLEKNKQLNKFSKIYFDKSKLNYSINEK